MRSVRVLISMLFVLPIASAGLVQAQSTSAMCKALVKSQTRFYLVSQSGTPVEQFEPGELSEATEFEISPVTLSNSGRRIAFIPKSPPNTFVIMDDKGHRLTFPSSLPAPNATHDSPDMLLSSKSPMGGIAWTSDGVIRLEKFGEHTGDRFEFYRFAGYSNQLIQVERPVYAIDCVASPVGGRVACLDGGVEVNGKLVFSNNRNSATRLTGSVTLGVGDSTLIPGTSEMRVQVLTAKPKIGLRVAFSDGGWQEQWILVGTPAFFDIDGGNTQLELLPTALNPATGKVTVKVFSTPASSTGFVGGIAWLPDHEGIVTVRNSPKGPELILLTSNAPNGLRVAASKRVDIEGGSVFLDPVSASDLYYQTPLHAGLVPLEASRHSGIQFGKPMVLPQKATLKLGQESLSLPVLTWYCH